MRVKTHIPPLPPPTAYRTAPAREKNISVHRAFVYGASVPGLGEYYAGYRLRGLATVLVFLIFSAWFTWLLIGIVGNLVSRILGSLDSLTPPALPQVSFISPAIAFFAMYFIWLWAMIDAVDLSVTSRHKTAAAPQASSLWATAISWFCPGAGQVYTGDRRFGYLIFTVYLMALLLTVPAYVHLVKNIVGLAKSGQLSPDSPLEVIDIIHGLVTRVNYSFGKLLQAFVRYFAVAAAIDVLGQGPLKKDTRWSKPSAAGAAALAGLGWLCPGSGQLLQARRRSGWLFLAGYIGSRALAGLLLGSHLITVAQADTAAWIPVMVQWGAVVEALIWMMTNRRHQ